MSDSNSLKKTSISKISKEEVEDYQFLLDSDVRYSIISAISVFHEPLTLSKIATLTGHPTTTLIHHIPAMLEKDLIKVQKVPKKRGKYYNITEKFIKIRNLKSQEMELENIIEKIDDMKNLTINEYRIEILKEIQKNLESQKVSINTADIIKSQSVFNKNVTNITSEYLKYLINTLNDENRINLIVPLTNLISQQFSFTFSNLDQVLEFEKINLTFLNQISAFRKRVEVENARLDEKGLDKAYMYFFTTPIINITD